MESRTSRAGALDTPPYGGKYQEEALRPAREDVWAGLGLVIVVSVILGTLFLVGRGREVPTESSPEEIAEAPAALLGDDVTLAGRVEELLTEQAFTLSSDGETVLVLIPPDAMVNGLTPVGLGSGAASQLAVRDAVIDVTGTLWSFDRDSMAEDLGLVLNERLFSPWEGQPVVVADQIATTSQASLTKETTP